MNEANTLAEITGHDPAANGLRITDADVGENIMQEFYFTGADGAFGAEMRAQIAAMQAGQKPEQVKAGNGQGPLELVTFCILVLRNGFTEMGIAHCSSHENFDPALGQVLARADAIERVKPLMIYAALCTKQDER